MRKPKLYKPVVTSLVVIYGVGYGTGYFNEVPTKALQLLSVSSSTAATVSFKMPDMINHNKEYDLLLPTEAHRPFTVIFPSS